MQQSAQLQCSQPSAIRQMGITMYEMVKERNSRESIAMGIERCLNEKYW